MIGWIGISIAMLVYYLTIWTMDFMVGPVKKRDQLRRSLQYLNSEPILRKTWREWFGKLLPKQWVEASYHFSTKQYVLYTVPVYVVVTGSMYFVFRSWFLALFAGLIAFSIPHFILKRNVEKRRNQLTVQLRDAMFSLTASLRAGASLQNAIHRGVIDLQRLFRNEPNAPIIAEFQRMSESLKTGTSLQDTLIAFRDHVQLEDVDDFVQATLIVRSTGGNLTEVMERIAQTISDKIATQQEIRVLTAGKRMEAMFLSIMPIAIVIILSFFSPEYMAPMFENWTGRVLLFIGFLFIGLNWIISRRLVRIDV